MSNYGQMQDNAPALPPHVRGTATGVGDGSKRVFLWRKVQTRSVFLSWMLFLATVVILLVVHLYPIIGYPWSTCAAGMWSWCVLAFHVFWLPIAAYVLYVWWWGIKYLTTRTAIQYRERVRYLIVVLTVTFGVETLVLANTDNSELREVLTLLALLVVIFTGAFTAILLVRAINEWAALDSRVLHPRSVAEVQEIVRKARRVGKTLRVRGSGHSESRAITGVDDDNVLVMSLDRFTGAVGRIGPRIAVFRGGTHLGHDPEDPLSTPENSALQKLWEEGYGLPDLGGITHQSVAGFMSTGSAGGSFKHDLGDAIMAVQLVDGQGRVRVLARNNDVLQAFRQQWPVEDAGVDEPIVAPEGEFFATVASVGLLGVITHVAFELNERFAIRGNNGNYQLEEKQQLHDHPVFQQRAGDESDMKVPEDASNMRRFFMTKDYARVLWWPQHGVHRFTLWDAERLVGELPRTKPSENFPSIGCCGTTPVQAGVSCFYKCVHMCGPTYNSCQACCIRQVIKVFTIPNEPGDEHQGDYHIVLPMDNTTSDELVPTSFIEAWFALDQLEDVLSAMHEHFENDHSMERTGSYSVEMYVAKESPFWMSASYKRHSFRVDIFWFDNECGDRDKFFNSFFALFDRFKPRYHLGKVLPQSPLNDHRGQSRQRFLELRRQFDPDDVFLTQYWRDKLIGPAAADDDEEELKQSR